MSQSIIMSFYLLTPESDETVEHAHIRESVRGLRHPEEALKAKKS